MLELTSIVSPIVGALAALLASVVAGWLASIRRKRLEDLRERALKHYVEVVNQQVEKYSAQAPSADIGEIRKLFEESATTSATASSPIATMSKAEVDKQIEHRVESLKNRLTDIERRFPDTDTIDKVASVNDAILATQLENLTESVKNIESKLLSRWDVAKVVFQIIAAVSALFGLVVAAVSFLSGS